MSSMSGRDPDTLNLEHLLQLGINSAKQGNREGARMLFQQVLDSDKRNERAWMWMASISDNEIDRRRFLETALQLNPKNEQARKYLTSMDNARIGSENTSMRLGLLIIVGILLLIGLVAVIVIVL